MSETLVNTIDGDKLYAERAVKDASGNSISETYATKSEIPVVDQSYDATSTNAQSGVAVAEALSNVPSSLSAGDGIDITSDVVSAKVDGSTITYNANGELQATASGGVTGGVTDVTVDGTSVVNGQGVAEITMPTFTQVQSDWSQSDNTQVDYIKNKPSLATVATSGDYDDLTNKPIIPAAQVNSDWNASSGVSEILNKPSLATVATSGDYDDLTNKPTINNVPSVGSADDGKALVAHYSGGSGTYSWDSLPSGIFPVEYGVTTYAQITAALTAGKFPVLRYVDSDNNTSYATFVYSMESSSPANYSFTQVRNVTSEIGSTIMGAQFSAWVYKISTQDVWSSNSIGSFDFQADWNNTKSTSLGYIKNKPTLATVATTGAYSDLSGTPTLATVATSGDYDDLTNKPSIPAAQVNSDWNASSGVAEILNKPNLATVATTGAYSDLSGTPTIPAAQVNSDWNASSGVAAILNKPTLATVATSGSYNDLSDKPKIPVMELFEAVYGTTTYADITAAIAAKKIVYCKVSPSGDTRMAFLVYIGSNTVEFQYYRSLSSRSATNQLDEVYVYTVNASGWTTTTRKAGVLIAAGTGLTSSYASGTVTINGKETDQTYNASSSNPQSGVAVAGALAGKEDAFTVGDGLEMVTSGNTRTLQVEAPVDIVAGPGIVIDNPDGNTLRVSQATPCDETVLWASDAWSEGGDVAPNTNSSTLSETIDNFERIRVYYRRSRPTTPSHIYSQQINEYDVSIIRSQGGKCLLAAVFMNTAMTGMYLSETMLTFNSANLGFAETQGGQASWGGTYSGGTCYLHPYKIVGIHRIANN